MKSTSIGLKRHHWHPNYSLDIRTVSSERELKFSLLRLKQALDRYWRTAAAPRRIGRTACAAIGRFGKWEKIGVGSFSHAAFGRPRGLIDDITARCGAVSITRSSAINGRPRCAADRISSSSEFFPPRSQSQPHLWAGPSAIYC